MDQIVEETDFVIGRPGHALDALMRICGDSVCVLDLDGRVVRSNAAFDDLYGWKPGQAVGRVLPHVLPQHHVRAVADLRRVASSGRVTEAEAKTLRSDGSHVPVRMSLVPVVDDEGLSAGVMAISSELSSQDRSCCRDDLRAIAAGRLLDPLTAVFASAQLLSRHEISSQSSRRDAALRMLTRQAERALRVAEDIELTARAAAGDLVVTKTRAHLGTLVAEAIRRLGDVVAPTLEIDPALGAHLIDRQLVARALDALLGNGLRRATSAEAVTVKVYRTSGGAVIDAVDDGPALSEAEIEALVNGTASDTVLPGGAQSALDLFLVRSICDAHGGSFHVRSAADGGTSFSMRLPGSADGIERSAR